MVAYQVAPQLVAVAGSNAVQQVQPMAAYAHKAAKVVFHTV